MPARVGVMALAHVRCWSLCQPPPPLLLLLLLLLLPLLLNAVWPIDVNQRR